jgi:aminoglycoside phosphotransferase (APT) family kinase protein
MHADQLPIDMGTVRRLIDDQFPQWQRKSIEAIATDGTVNAIFRIGSELSARFPLRGEDPVAT